MGTCKRIFHSGAGFKFIKAQSFKDRCRTVLEQDLLEWLGVHEEHGEEKMKKAGCISGQYIALKTLLSCPLLLIILIL